MFPHVIGSLGGCSLIKQEDAGVTFSRSDNVILPDYRVVTNDGRTFLIEVKNFHQRNVDQKLRIKNDYLEWLSMYAAINKVDLLVAIYFSRFHEWTLVPATAFMRNASWSSIDFGAAIMANKMGLLGDRMVATTPPLAIEFVASAPNARSILDSGASNIPMTIQTVGVTCAGRQVLDAKDRELAYFLIGYGGWRESVSPLALIDDETVSFGFSYEPHQPVEGQGFQFLSSLSGMVSRVFLENTGDRRIDLEADPFELLTLPPEAPSV